MDFRREIEDTPCFGEIVLLIENAEGRLAVVRGRGASPGAFDLPTGVIEEAENVEEVALREALEETGRRVRLRNLVGIYRVRIRWRAWNLERWFVAFRCLALSETGTPQDIEEIEEVKFVRIPEEIPGWWSGQEFVQWFSIGLAGPEENFEKMAREVWDAWGRHRSSPRKRATS